MRGGGARWTAGARDLKRQCVGELRDLCLEGFVVLRQFYRLMRGNCGWFQLLIVVLVSTAHDI